MAAWSGQTTLFLQLPQRLTLTRIYSRESDGRLHGNPLFRPFSDKQRSHEIESRRDRNLQEKGWTVTFRVTSHRLFHDQVLSRLLILAKMSHLKDPENDQDRGENGAWCAFLL